ncbi:MAG: type IV secretory system conjugative DNA transfer family protein [Alphaproteobacteria bacterium]|uniref:Type IV secretory system conjugative DNA transfer family protein n=1 Tax=Candidatus Nitrobium versatile TaxID=2884831 RepID=A0A953M0B1_9BACT|nr:type IV secretory system conjugative DNA transfer family protein [Candidatus Nitrobium versatile]
MHHLEQILNKSFLADIAHYLRTTTGLPFTPSQILVFFVVLVGVPSLFLILYALLYTRARTRIGNHPAATGRFATDREVLKNFRIPTKGYFLKKWTVIGSLVLFVLGETVFFLIKREISLSPFLVLLPVCFSSVSAYFIIHSEGPLLKKVAGHNYFQIGAYKGVRVGIKAKGRQEGILVPGPTGSGKTSSFLLTNLMSDAHGDSSAIVIDRKTDEDIVDIIGHAWQKQGKKVINFDPYTWKMNINPLLLVEPDFSRQETHDAIREIIESLFGSYFAHVGEMGPDTDHFIGREYRLLKAIIMAVLKLPIEYRNLVTVFDAVKLPPDELTRLIACTGDKQVTDEFRFFTGSSVQERVNALQGIYRKLQFLDAPVMRQALVRNDFDLNLFFRDPCLFVIKAPLHREDMGIMASMITRLLQMRHYEYAALCYREGKKPRPIWYYLDEFGHLNLPNAHTLATTIRSSGGGLIICVQDKEDLREFTRKLKSGSAKAFESSLRTMVVLPGCHHEMCKEISAWLGDIPFENHYKMRGIFEIINFRYQKRIERAPLLTPDSLHYMNEEQCLVLTKKRPFFALQLPYYKDKRLKRLIGKPVKFHMPSPVQEIRRGEISALLKERASDIQHYGKAFDTQGQKEAIGAPGNEDAPLQANRGSSMVRLQSLGEYDDPMDDL